MLVKFQPQPSKSHKGMVSHQCGSEGEFSAYKPCLLFTAARKGTGKESFLFPEVKRDLWENRALTVINVFLQLENALVGPLRLGVTALVGAEFGLRGKVSSHTSHI